MSVNGQNGSDISGLTLASDGAGGLALDRGSQSTVHNITTADEPHGVFLRVNTLNVALDSVSPSPVVARGRRRQDHQGHAPHQLDDRHRACWQVSRSAATTPCSTASRSRTAIRVERGAGRVTNGMVTSVGTSGLVVKDLSTDGLGNDAVRNLSPGMRITGGQIRGGNTGVGLQAATTLTSTSAGKMMFHMLGAIAEFERELISERTRSRQAARGRGRKGGRSPKLYPAQLRTAPQLRKARNLTIGEIVDQFGVCRGTLYNALRAEPSAPA